MNESDYYQKWVGDFSESTPYQLAVSGGDLAETPGQIFMAGYQAAIRATFPDLHQNGWYSFAVTEDRSEEDPKPGVTMAGSCVSGFKTWIAGAAHVDTIVLKVGRGADALYGTAKVDDSVAITTRSARFLPDMSQGTAEFQQSEFHAIDAAQVSKFREYEPYFIYIAFLACVGKQGWIVSDQAKAVLNQGPALKALDLEVSSLVSQINESDLKLGDNWEIDQRLFTMYSKGIQR